MQFSAIACVPRSGKVLLLWISSFLALRSHQNFCSSLILAYSNGQIHLGCIYLEQFGLWWQSVLSICWPECQCPAEQPEGVEFKRSQHQDDLTCFCFQRFNAIVVHSEEGVLDLCFPPKFMKASVWWRKAKLWLSNGEAGSQSRFTRSSLWCVCRCPIFFFLLCVSSLPTRYSVTVCEKVHGFMSQWRYTFIKMPATGSPYRHTAPV